MPTGPFTARHLLSAALTLAVFGGVLTIAAPSSDQIRDERGNEPARTWPMFGGTPGRNMANPLEQNLPLDWSDEKGKLQNIKWIAQLGSKSYGGPVIAGGKVFIGTNNERPRDPKVIGDRGVMMCFREADGAFLWQRIHAKLPSGIVNDWPKEGIVSMPAVEGDRLYYVSNRCELVCADTDGKDVWTLDMMKELGVLPHNLAVCSPLIFRDLVFVVTGNGVNENHIDIPAPSAPSFLAVYKRTGKVAWQDNSPTAAALEIKVVGAERQAALKQMRDRGEILLHGQWSNPTLAQVDGQGQVIYPGGDGWLRAFEPATGKLLWKFDCNPKTAVYRLGNGGTRNDFIATPVVHGNRLYIGVGQDPEHDEGVGHLWCIDLTRALALGKTNRGQDVSPVDDNFDPTAGANRNSALAWYFGGPATDEMKKSLPRNFAFGRTLSSCAVHEGLVYAADLYGYVFCLDAMSGRLYWWHDTLSPIWSSPYYADGKVYIANDGGEVLVFRHGKTKELLNTVEFDKGPAIRGVPVAVNGTLYFTAGSKLYAIRRDRK